MARPTKLTPELQKKILDLVAEGNFESTAALACGVTPRSYMRWKQLGAQGKAPYAAFFELSQMAAAKGEAAMVALTKFAGLGKRRYADKDGTIREEKFEGDPKPIEFLMQRRFAKRWGQFIRVELDKTVEDMMGALREGLDGETFRRVVEALQSSRDRATDTVDGGLAGEFDSVD